MAKEWEVTSQHTGGFTHIFFVPIVCGTPVFLLAPALASTYTLSLLCVYALLAMSLGLIWGFGGILCFGQGAFFGIGAYSYVIFSINFGLPWTSVLFAIAFTVLVTTCFGAAMFYGRLGDVYLAVVTLVFTLILNRFLNSTAGPEYQIGSARLGGFNGIPGFPTLNFPWSDAAFLSDMVFYILCCVVLVISWVFCRWILRSHFGRVLVAIRENEERVELTGYDVRLYKTAAFSISEGLAAMAGVLYANWAGIVTPNLFSLTLSAEIIIWTVVGGLGTLFGPMIGSAVLTALKLGLGHQTVVDNFFVMGILLIAAVLVFPRGIAGVFKGRRVSFLGSKKKGKWQTRSNRTQENLSNE